MEYTLISDLHQDFHKTPFEWPLKELVIVAGDTSNSVGASLKMLDAMREHGHTVFAVPGNHEHYIGLHSLPEAEQVFRNHNAPIFFGEGFNILGVNGWYKIENEDHWLGYMSDSRFVTVQDVNAAAERDASFLDNHLTHSTVPSIVVTHTAPCEESLDPRFAGSEGNVYFWNPHMKPLLAKHADKILRWHHGHTHTAVNVTVDGVNIITNPRGYPSENPDWTPLHLTIPGADRR